VTLFAVVVPFFRRPFSLLVTGTAIESLVLVMLLGAVPAQASVEEDEVDTSEWDRQRLVGEHGQATDARIIIKRMITTPLDSTDPSSSATVSRPASTGPAPGRRAPTCTLAPQPRTCVSPYPHFVRYLGASRDACTG
jgi:hypothetical protein